MSNLVLSFQTFQPTYKTFVEKKTKNILYFKLHSLKYLKILTSDAHKKLLWI